MKNWFPSYAHGVVSIPFFSVGLLLGFIIGRIV
jgi:hypothetical protein